MDANSWMSNYKYESLIIRLEELLIKMDRLELKMDRLERGLDGKGDEESEHVERSGDSSRRREQILEKVRRG